MWQPLRSLTPGLAALLLVAAAGATYATDDPINECLTGSWDGGRDRWHQAGVAFNLHYTAEPMTNVSGGEERGGTYADNIGLDFSFDLDRLIGLGGTSLLATLSQRNGDSLSADYIAPSASGNTFTVQELYGGQTFKVANVQLTTRLLADRLELAYGRLVANDDFLRSPLYCQFVNNSFCGSPKPVFLQDPFTFSAYPTAQWGARARYDSEAGDWTFLAAVYDGDPELKGGDPTDPGHNRHGTNWKLGDNGAVFAGEVQYHRHRGSRESLPSVYKLGGYYMTGEFRDIGRTDNARVQDNAMVWLLADQMLYRERAGADAGLSWFGALVWSLADDVNAIDRYFNTGLVYRGLFAARPLDTTGIAVTSGWYSDELNHARRAEGKSEQDYEAVIELNHKLALGHGVSLQPDIQYILRPGGTGDIEDALAIGARVAIQF